jgi:hypothetical protein
VLKIYADSKIQSEGFIMYNTGYMNWMSLKMRRYIRGSDEKYKKGCLIFM